MPIRRLERRDIADIVEICNASIARGESSYGPEPVTLDQMAAALLDVPAPFEAYVYERDGGGLVGWAALMRHTQRPIYDTIAELATFVSTEHRAQGIGRELVAHAVARASVVGFRALLLILAPEPTWVMTWAMRRLGFRNVGWLGGVLPAEPAWNDILVFHKALPVSGEG